MTKQSLVFHPLNKYCNPFISHKCLFDKYYAVSHMEHCGIIILFQTALWKFNN